MSKIRLTLPDTPINGKQISFIAPCGSENVEGLLINAVDYSLVDANGLSVAGIDNVWESGAMLSVLLNVDNHKAYVLNPTTNAYLEDRLTSLVPVTVSTKLLASNWSNNEYSLSKEYSPDTYDIEIALNGGVATEDEKIAFDNAEMVGTLNNTVKAFGEVPTLDIPVLIKAVRK